MLRSVDKVESVEMRESVAKIEGCGTIMRRQPKPDRTELEQRFTKVLVRLQIFVVFELLKISQSTCNIIQYHHVVIATVYDLIQFDC